MNLLLGGVARIDYISAVTAMWWIVSLENQPAKCVCQDAWWRGKKVIIKWKEPSL